METPTTIAIYFDEPDKMGYPFHDHEYYESYVKFNALCKERGVQVYIVRGDSYEGNMRFSSGWQFDNAELVEVSRPIHCDLIYIKGKGSKIETAKSDVVVNDPEFEAIGRSKIKTYELLSDFMAPTYAIDASNWQEVITKISTSKVVLKPVGGAEGRGVIVTETAGFDFNQHSINEPYLAQEFIDSSKGIPGLTDGYHDLRVILFNGKPELSFIRIPKSGSFLSNLAQGGSLKIVDIADLPQSVIDVVAAVDQKFTHFNPRIYTIDFMFEGERPFICEINTRPGFPTFHPDTYRNKFYESLLTVLMEVVSKRK